MSDMQVEPASFRDASSAVFYADGRVLRGLGKDAAADWEALDKTEFFARRVGAGDLVPTTRRPLGQGYEHVDARKLGWTALLEHERIPFVSYPYEWTFSMLKDAALLHLDLLLDALDEGMTMKDGYAFNLQWRGACPTFIDIPSFERAEQAGPWAGYRQFCETFLFPLMLQAHKRAPFQPWLRGSLDGIEAAAIRRIFTWRDVTRAGVFKHLVLHNAVQARFQGDASRMSDDLRTAGFSTELTKATVKNIRKVLTKLRRRDKKSNWSKYRGTCTYTEIDTDVKRRFVSSALAEGTPDLVWDLGCNDGAFSRIAASSARYVVAIDTDEFVVDRLYTQLASERNPNILPLVMNLGDPSPNLGWRCRERRSLFHRDRPQMLLALALVHHLSIAGNIPIAEVVDWLISFNARLVIEFVDPGDPQAQRLLANKPPGQHRDYTRENFERHLKAAFQIERRQVLSSRTRVLYVARPRA